MNKKNTTLDYFSQKIYYPQNQVHCSSIVLLKYHIYWFPLEHLNQVTLLVSPSPESLFHDRKKLQNSIVLYIFNSTIYTEFSNSSQVLFMSIESRNRKMFLLQNVLYMYHCQFFDTSISFTINIVSPSK